MPAGLLPQISHGLGVSEALAGQLVTLYALGSVLAAIPVIAATRGWNRRPLFLMAIGGLLVFNTITALSAHYGLTLAARFVAGMAAGVVWGLLAGYARRLVPPRLQGRALAVAGVGQPIALAIGVPLGTWLGTLFDWRGVFWIMSALSLLLSAWVRLAVPDFAGQSAGQRLPIRRVFTMPGIRPVQLVLFGVASIAGIWFTGLLVDRCLRALTLSSLAVFAAAALVLGFSGGSAVAVLIGVAAWGLTFGGAPTLLQTALADNAGEAADVAQSMLVTVFNLAVAGGRRGRRHLAGAPRGGLATVGSGRAGVAGSGRGVVSQDACLPARPSDRGGLTGGFHVPGGVARMVEGCRCGSLAGWPLDDLATTSVTDPTAHRASVPAGNH